MRRSPSTSPSEAATSIPPTAIPVDDYTYVELGNFLTDVSQFRDPVAFHGARDKAHARALAQSGLTDSFGGKEWVKDVFGQHSGPVHGALPEMFRMLMQAFAHELFDDDGLPRLGGALGLLPGGARPALIPAHGIPPARVDAVLAAHYTQYFPHEHLDFPPTRDLPHHRTERIFMRQSRGLIGYLEWFLQYISEELSKLEADWVTARAGPFPADRRQDLLVRLGHLLHPLEDYFFHSNLLELWQWAEVRSAHPSAVPTVPADLRTLVDDSLRGTRLSPTSVRLPAAPPPAAALPGLRHPDRAVAHDCPTTGRPWCSRAGSARPTCGTPSAGRWRRSRPRSRRCPRASTRGRPRWC